MLKTIIASYFAFIIPCLAAPDPPAYVGVWKYFGNDFNQVKFLELIPNADGSFKRYSSLLVDINQTKTFSPYTSRMGSADGYHSFMRPNPVMDELKKNDEIIKANQCNPLPYINRMFSVQRMLDRKVVSAKRGSELLLGAAKLNPNQLTYFETIRTLPESAVIEKFGKIPSHARANPNHRNIRKEELRLGNPDDPPTIIEVDLDREEQVRKILATLDGGSSTTSHTPRQPYIKPTFYDVKTSSILLISGQSPGTQHTLPLIKSASGSSIEKAITHKEFPFHFELGGFAGENKDDFNALFEAALFQVKSEVALLKGNLVDAYIFAHTPDLQHQKLYELLFGMKPYSGYKDKGAEHVMFASVTDLEKKLKLKNNINQKTISVDLLKSQINQISNSTYLNQNNGIYIRLLEPDPKFMHTLKPNPLISLHEEKATSMGAHHPHHSFLSNFRKQNSPDNYKYYNKIGNYYTRTGFDKGTLQNKYYLRSICYDLKAAMFDGLAKPQPSVDDFDKHLAAFFLKKRYSKKPLNINHIAFSREDYPSDLVSPLKKYNLNEEVIYDVKPEFLYQQDKFSKPVYSKGGTMRLFYMSITDAEKYVEDHLEKFEALFKKFDSDLKPKNAIQNFWSEPLSGT